MLVIKQIRLPLRSHPILFIASMITDQIELQSVLLQLLIWSHKLYVLGKSCVIHDTKLFSAPLILEGLFFLVYITQLCFLDNVERDSELIAFG